MDDDNVRKFSETESYDDYDDDRELKPLAIFFCVLIGMTCSSRLNIYMHKIIPCSCCFCVSVFTHNQFQHYISIASLHHLLYLYLHHFAHFFFFFTLFSSFLHPLYGTPGLVLWCTVCRMKI